MNTKSVILFGLFFAGQCYAQNVVQTFQITAAENDAEEQVSSGIIDLNSTTLEMCDDGTTVDLQIVGYRFTNITIPKDATITTAYVQFSAAEGDNSDHTLKISAEDIGDSPIFTTTPFDLSDRTLTSEFVYWNPLSWSTAERTSSQQTPEIRSVLQSIINRTDWAAGNALSLLFHFEVNDEGERVAEAYDSNPAASAVLYVDYTVGGVNGNQIMEPWDTDAAEEQLDVPVNLGLYPAGTILCSSSDLEFMRDNDHSDDMQNIALRFQSIAIPPGSTVTSAFIQFTSEEQDHYDYLSVNCYGELINDSPTFNDAILWDVSNRSKTTTSLLWEPPGQNRYKEKGSFERTQSLDGTLNLDDIMNEIIALPTWASGNAMSFIFEGSDATRSYFSPNTSNSDRRPELYYTYTPPPVFLDVSQLILTGTKHDESTYAFSWPTNDDFETIALQLSVDAVEFSNIANSDYSIGQLDYQPSEMMDAELLYFRIASNREEEMLYSNVVALPNSLEHIHVFPNPVLDNIEIRVPTDQNYRVVHLTDVMGRRMKSQLIPHSGILNLSLKQYSGGTYYLVFESSNQLTTTIKIQKQ